MPKGKETSCPSRRNTRAHTRTHRNTYLLCFCPASSGLNLSPSATDAFFGSAKTEPQQELNTFVTGSAKTSRGGIMSVNFPKASWQNDVERDDSYSKQNPIRQPNPKCPANSEAQLHGKPRTKRFVLLGNCSLALILQMSRVSLTGKTAWATIFCGPAKRDREH